MQICYSFRFDDVGKGIRYHSFVRAIDVCLADVALIRVMLTL